MTRTSLCINCHSELIECRFYTVAIKVGNTTTAVNLGKCLYITYAVV